MKKINQLLLGLCLLPLGLSAQYSQGFNSATMPGDWTVINGGDVETWKTWSLDEDTFNPRSGSHMLGIYFNTDFSIWHDDYAISPAITITAGISDRLTFWARNKGISDLDNFDIKISTTAPTAAALTGTLATTITPPRSWTPYSYDLTPYIGQTIYIAFHTKNRGWFVGIDDFEVSSNTTLNVSEKVRNNATTIYPNPVKDVLNIKTKSKISEVSLFDITGRLQNKQSVSSDNTSLNVSGLSTGNYILKIKEGNQEKSYKVIKK